MTKEEFVIYCIQHHEDFPNVGEIDLQSAQIVLENLAPDKSLPIMTAEEFMTTWNALVHDPEVTSLN